MAAQHRVAFKQAFLGQLLTLPQKNRDLVLQKVSILQEEPAPAGANRKRLKGSKVRLYRIRVGDYRVLYHFGSDWVELLAVEHRKDVYEHGLPAPDQLDLDIPDVEVGEPVDDPRHDFDSAEVPVRPRARNAEDDLPYRIDGAFLTQLRVPSEHFASLDGVSDLQELMDAAIPEELRDRIFNVVAAKDPEAILQDQSFLARDAEQLRQYAEGNQVEFAFRLDPEQERYLNWIGQGPVLIKGGPGTGKSTLALYSAQSFIERLRQQGIDNPRILFTTFTKALTRNSDVLLQRLLGKDAPRVDVMTVDALVLRIVKSHHSDLRPIVDQRQAEDWFQKALSEVRRSLSKEDQARFNRLISKLSLPYLKEEIEVVIAGRGLKNFEEYRKLDRHGRRVALIEGERALIWQIHDALQRIHRSQHQADWHTLRAEALRLVAQHGFSDPYDAVIVDEAQDLDIAALRVLLESCRDRDWLFIAADANQSIFGGDFRWAEVHEGVRRSQQTAILKKNYRSTRQINEFAHAILHDGAIDFEDVVLDSPCEGEAVVVRRVEREHDAFDALAEFFIETDSLYKTRMGVSALLVPTKETAQTYSEALRARGLHVKLMDSQSFEFSHRGVAVMPLQSVKGLEFPAVAIAGLHTPAFLRRFATVDSDQSSESMALQRRQLFVAMSRAQQHLMVLIPAPLPESASVLFTGLIEEETRAPGMSPDLTNWDESLIGSVQEPAPSQVG